MTVKQIFAAVPALLLSIAASAQSCHPPAGLLAKISGTPTAADYLEAGVWFADRQQYDCAANAFGASLQADPHQREYPRVAFMFGSALYFAGDIKEAIPSLQAAEQLGYRDEKIHIILATALDSSGPRADAESEWRLALAFDPELTSALDALSTDLIADADYNAAIAVLDQPRLEAQRTAQQAANLATAYAKTGKPNRAIAILQDALNTWPDSAELAKQLADTLTRQGRQQEAARVLQLAQSRSKTAENREQGIGNRE